MNENLRESHIKSITFNCYKTWSFVRFNVEKTLFIAFLEKNKKRWAQELDLQKTKLFWPYKLNVQNCIFFAFVTSFIWAVGLGENLIRPAQPFFFFTAPPQNKKFFLPRTVGKFWKKEAKNKIFWKSLKFIFGL